MTHCFKSSSYLCVQSVCNLANISSNTPRNIFDVHHLVDLPMECLTEENISMSVANASHSASMTRQDGLSASSSCYEKSLCPVWKAALFMERLFWHCMLSHFTCTFQREKCSLISIETSVLTFELQHGPLDTCTALPVNKVHAKILESPEQHWAQHLLHCGGGFEWQSLWWIC